MDCPNPYVLTMDGFARYQAKESATHQEELLIYEPQCVNRSLESKPIVD
jgi:hypothetical protein